MDVGRFIRLRGAIRETLASMGEAANAGAVPLSERCEVFRREAVDLIDEDFKEEFARLFPENVQGAGSSSPGTATARVFERAKGLLASLAGWLDGEISRVQMQMEAEADAKERARQQGQYA